jgi:hypothetical protein
VLIEGPAAVELVAFAERAHRVEPRLVMELGPHGRRALADLNALALDERQRRAEVALQAELVSVAELARRSGYSPRTIRRWAASGRIAAERRGGQWAVDPAAA